MWVSYVCTRWYFLAGLRVRPQRGPARFREPLSPFIAEEWRLFTRAFGARALTSVRSLWLVKMQFWTCSRLENMWRRWSRGSKTQRWFHQHWQNDWFAISPSDITAMLFEWSLLRPWWALNLVRFHHKACSEILQTFTDGCLLPRGGGSSLTRRLIFSSSSRNSKHVRLLFTGLLLDLYLYIFITSCCCQSALFGADSKAIGHTCPKALLPAEGATARVHQVSKVSPACRSLIKRKFHGFGNSENNNNKKTSHHNTEQNNKNFPSTDREMYVMKRSDTLEKVFSVFLRWMRG